MRSAQQRDLQRSPRRVREPRRLVAVMAADIAGYSRLMGADEDGTLRALNSCRRIASTLLKRHHGRMVSTYMGGPQYNFAGSPS